MAIRKRVLYVVGTACTILIVLLYSTTQIFLASRFGAIERDSVHQSLLQVVNALDNELHDLGKETDDWASWDDTYRFIATGDPNYISINLPDETFMDLQLNLILYLDKSNRVVYGKAFDLTKAREIRDPRIFTILALSDRLTNVKGEQSRTGIVLLPEGPLLLAAHAILTSERKGPSRGSLMMGRFLNQDEIRKLATITHLPIAIYPYVQFQNRFQEKRFHLDLDHPKLVQPLNGHQVLGGRLLSDLSGNPVLVATVQLPRNIYRQGQASIFYFGLSLVGVGVFLAILVAGFLGKVVLNRLASLNQCIKQIAISSDLSIRLPVSGADELSNFARVLNRMMNNLEQMHQKLEDSNRQLAAIIEFLPDATLVIDEAGRVVAWNRAMEEMTGVPKQEIIGRGDYAYAIPFYGKPRPLLIDLVQSDPGEIKRYYEHTEKKGSVLYSEVYVDTIGKKQGGYLWITASPLVDQEGRLVRAIESMRDITKRKKIEEELKYLSLHDPLTGLYDRAYFEEEIRRLERGREPVVGVIMCDVDGLKLVNDSLGHSTGDKLLQTAANVIRSAFRQNDVVARVGGDEFAVLLPQCDGTLLETAGRRVQESVENHNRSNPELPLSISLGWAFRKEASVRLKDVFEEADNNMYREKLQHHQSNRSAIVQTLMNTLRARDFVTEDHADRLKKLVADLSRKLGLDEQKIHDISLLAQFHDIGKVGIPDQILFKQGPLTQEEWKIMRRHTEIGYSIAHSAQELMHISDWILMHHERWDGGGYPRGLKGDAIPLECRILSIADSYDAMTSDRPYRKALTHSQAVQELRKCAGTQFEPKLVEEFIEMIGE
ncbi:MAG TPA: CHASE4 domain-containing protein [Bacillota bacterium]